MSHLVPPWPPGSLPDVPEQIFVHFVSHCRKVLNLRYDTIKLYLAGIRFHYIKQRNVDILKDNLQLHYILRATKKLQPNEPQLTRLPITFPILQDLLAILKSGLLSRLLGVMYASIFSTAFYGFLRCGEFTVSGPGSPFPRLRDVALSEDLSLFMLTLHSSKTDPFGKGVKIPIFNTHPLYPVTLTADYISLRRQQGASPDAPLFVESELSNAPLTRSTFLSVLRQVLAAAGYADSNFSGHSFRIGACTSGAAGGVQDHLLQTLGRWQSDCYTRYIHVQMPCLSLAQSQMNTK
jgi:hypothetical protein